jgi:hypothetical protein
MMNRRRLRPAIPDWTPANCGSLRGSRNLKAMSMT